MSNFEFAYMCLLTLVSLCNGENCQANYKVIPACAAQYYGTISSKYLGIRSVSECATICNNEGSCRSAIYNYKTEKCRTYSFHLDNLASNCTEMVKYVALDTFEGFCFTSRVAETTTSPPRGIFDPCSINTDCDGIGAAECRHDMCQCVPLLSYEPTSNTCVAECITYGTIFQEDLGRYLGSITADKTQNKPTAGKCKDSCVNESLFKCRAAEFISYDNKCRLHSEDSLKSKTIDYQTNNDYELYIRDCAYTNTGTLSTTTQQSNVIEITIPPTTFPPTSIPHPPPTTIPHPQPPTTLPSTTIPDTLPPTTFPPTTPFPPTTIPDTPPSTTIPNTPQPTTFPPTTIPDTPPPTTFPPTTIPDKPPPTTFPPTTIPDTPPPTIFPPTTIPDTPPPTTFPPTTIPDTPPPTTFPPTTNPDTPPPTTFLPTTMPDTPPPTTFPPTTIPQTQTPTTQSSIYSSCFDDIGCEGIPDAECRYGQCQCQPGLSHDPISNSCVQECDTYGTTFNDLQDHYLSYPSDDMIADVSDPHHCMHLCIEETSYVCRVAELYHPTSYCLLYSEDTFNSNDLTLNPSVSYDHYMRDCAAQLSTTVETSVLPNSIFSACTDHADCIGVSDAECRYDQCQCLPGMSHDPTLNICVEGCMTYGLTFQEFHGHHLTHPSWYNSYGTADPVQCMNFCIEQSGFVCRVAEVNHLESYCLLFSDASVHAHPLDFDKNIDFDHYMRDCAAVTSPTPSPLPPSTTPTIPTYSTYPPLETSTPSSMSCIDDTDCMGNFDFVCRYEICRCLPGLSYDPSSNGCVQECATYGTTFQELQDNYLSFNSDDMIGGITDPVECINLCIAESSYVCRVAELYHPNSYCLLYSEETFNAYMYELTFNPSVSYDHYTRDCAVDHPPTTSPSTSPPLMSPNTPPSTTYPPMEMSTPPSYIFSACMDNTDCEEISDAECRYERCQCIPGLSHDPVSNGCVQECAIYGTTFQELQDNCLSLNVDHIILSTSDPVECMNWCIAEPSFVCRAAELYYPNSHCRLYSVETIAANTITFNPSASYDLYMRDCSTE